MVLLDPLVLLNQGSHKLLKVNHLSSLVEVFPCYLLEEGRQVLLPNRLLPGHLQQ